MFPTIIPWPMTPHLTNHSQCATASIFTCCHTSCPSSPKIFFLSHHAFNDHCTTTHPLPPPLPLLTHMPNQQPHSPSSPSSLTETQPHPQATIGLIDSTSSQMSMTMNPPTSAPLDVTSFDLATNPPLQLPSCHHSSNCSIHNQLQ